VREFLGAGLVYTAQGVRAGILVLSPWGREALANPCRGMGLPVVSPLSWAWIGVSRAIGGLDPTGVRDPKAGRRVADRGVGEESSRAAFVYPFDGVAKCARDRYERGATGSMCRLPGLSAGRSRGAMDQRIS